MRYTGIHTHTLATLLIGIQEKYFSVSLYADHVMFYLF